MKVRFASLAVFSAALVYLGCFTVAAQESPAPAVSATPEISSTPIIAAPAKKTASKKSASKPVAANSVHVYLLRGLLNVFSLGMDELADKIRAQGIQASVHNHTEWEGLADTIAAQYKAGNHAPVILIGHSLGADSVCYMADYLGKRGVPVALVVPYDGTQTMVASANVQRMLNFTQRDYAFARRGAGFHGELQNVDVSSQGIDHLNIDKSSRLHAMTVAKIVAVVKKGEVPAEFATFTGDKEKEKAKTAESAKHGPKAIVEVGLKPEAEKPETTAIIAPTAIPAHPVEAAKHEAPAQAAAVAPAPAPAVHSPVISTAVAVPAPVVAPVSAQPAITPAAASKPVSDSSLEYEKLTLPKH